MAFSEQDLNENQRKIAALISAKAEEMGVDRDFALAVAHAESRLSQFDEKNNVILGPPPKKKSGERAVGIMQVLPSTAKDYGFSPKDLRDPEKNIAAGVTYLKHLIEKSEGDKATAAAMYNWGPGNSFFRTGQGELPTETINYLKHIKSVGGLGEGEPSPNEPKVEPSPNEPKQLVEVEPTPNEATPEATIHQQDAVNPAEDAQKNKEMAMATGAVLGAGYGFAESRLNAAETRAMREEMARERVRAQYAQSQAQQASESEGLQTRIRLQSGALPEAPATGGTSGEKWSRNWRGVETLGSRSVPESASMYQRGKVQGGSKVSQRINKLYPKLSPDDPNAIWERLGKQTDERAAAAAEQQMQQRMLEERANQQRLIQIEEDTNRAREARLEAERPINRARSALNSVRETPLGQIGARVAETAFKRLPVVGYGAAAASMGRNVAEIDEALQKQEYINALIAASQLAATGASMVPAFAPVAVPAAFGLEAVKQVRDYYR
jgi:soluble lytic murein transglycosylase-like protein